MVATNVIVITDGLCNPAVLAADREEEAVQHMLRQLETFEEPEQSWRVERVLGPKGIPNRVDAWDEEWRHDWVTWREMLPQFLAEFLPAKAESASEE